MSTTCRYGEAAARGGVCEGGKGPRGALLEGGEGEACEAGYSPPKKVPVQNGEVCQPKSAAAAWNSGEKQKNSGININTNTKIPNT